MPVTTLLYFHATSREQIRGAKDPQDIDAIVAFLKNGPVVPSGATGTKRNEAILGITPNRVYAYLARTDEEFGPNCIVVDSDAAATGEVSPFDTGGLVQHIKPIADRVDADKQNFLKSLSFPVSQLKAALALYPTTIRDSHNQYVDGLFPPPLPGPHALWTSVPPYVDWTHAKCRWPWWTWEVRAQKLVVDQLRAWTCTPGDVDPILEAAAKLYPSDRLWRRMLESTYFEGAIGKLVETMRPLQRMA